MRKFKKGQRVLVEAVIDSDGSCLSEDIYLVNTFCENVHLTKVREDKIRLFPEKVKIPKFAAGWIERCRANKFNLQHAMDSDYAPANVFVFILDTPDIFARAWLDGYEVEQEPLYTVEIPNSKECPIILVKDLVAEDVYMIPKRHFKMVPEDYGSLNNHLTESEIRKDFEWAWQAGFAKEVEDDTEI